MGSSHHLPPITDLSRAESGDLPSCWSTQCHVLKVFLAQFTVLMRTDSETEGSEILVIQREPQAGECSCNKGAVGMN